MGECNRIVLARYPEGAPTVDDFRLETGPIPHPSDNDVLIRTIYISVDPGTRTRMTDTASYAPPIPIGTVMHGAAVGEVIESNNAKFDKGDYVSGLLAWQDISVSNGKGLVKIPKSSLPLSASIGVLGIPGLTAYFSILGYGEAKEGETIVVSSAAGAVGSAAIQIAKIHGCRAVGIAGGSAKCAWVKDELGADAVIDYKAVSDIGIAVNAACPEGVDIYLDNVGNAFIDAIIPYMNVHGRIVISGQIAEYNRAAHERDPIRNSLNFITHRLRMCGFVVFDDAREFPKAIGEMSGWIADGRLRFKEEIVDGLAAAPEAFSGLFRGDNFGRRLVRVGPEKQE